MSVFMGHGQKYKIMPDQYFLKCLHERRILFILFSQFYVFCSIYYSIMFFFLPLVLFLLPFHHSFKQKFHSLLTDELKPQAAILRSFVNKVPGFPLIGGLFISALYSICLLPRILRGFFRNVTSSSMDMSCRALTLFVLFCCSI